MDILAESIRYGLSGKWIIIFMVALGIFLIGFLIFLNGLQIPGLVAMIVGMIITVAVFHIYKEPHKRLKVILSDDYSVSELYENYTIVDQDGKIWILDEKH